MDQSALKFFSSPFYAVIGASQDASKFGYKILSWYTQHNLPVTPINPARSSITVKTRPAKTLATIASVGALPNPQQTGLSFLTPPKVTAKVLRDAHDAGVRSVWLQPGSFGTEEMEYAKDHFEDVVGGFEGGTRGGEGWCVLVDGEEMIRRAQATAAGGGGVSGKGSRI